MINFSFHRQQSNGRLSTLFWYDIWNLKLHKKHNQTIIQTYPNKALLIFPCLAFTFWPFDLMLQWQVQILQSPDTCKFTQPKVASIVALPLWEAKRANGVLPPDLCQISLEQGSSTSIEVSRSIYGTTTHTWDPPLVGAVRAGMGLQFFAEHTQSWLVKHYSQSTYEPSSSYEFICVP